MNPAAKSKPNCTMALRFGFVAGSFSRNGTSFWVPNAEYQMVATIATANASASGA